MRSADILGLALSVLYQQKLRTVLTTLGVLFGTFVLVASLAVGRGVQDTIRREWSRYGELRRIEVRPRYDVAQPPDVSKEELQVRGTMSEAKRERIRQRLVERWQGEHPRTPKTLLDAEQLRRFAPIDHVRVVAPSVELAGRVVLNGQAEAAVTHSAPPDHRHCVNASWPGSS